MLSGGIEGCPSRTQGDKRKEDSPELVVEVKFKREAIVEVREITRGRELAQHGLRAGVGTGKQRLCLLHLSDLVV